MMEAAVRIRGVGLSFGERLALAGVDLEVPVGSLFGLVGPNGGGKSTLFRIVATLLRPQRGVVEVMGRDVSKTPHAARMSLAAIFQSPGLDKKLTVMENLRHQGHLYGLRGRRLMETASRLLDLLGVSDRARDRVETLSGGLARRVEIAKALLHHPKLLLADEPTTGLDPGVRREVWDLLRDLREREGMTILVASHLMEEAKLCDRVAILNRGKVAAVGTPEELRGRVGGDVVSVQADDASSLIEGVGKELRTKGKLVDGIARFEPDDGRTFLAELLACFPDRVRSVTFGKPTLLDAFVHITGETFESAERGEPHD